MKQIVLIGILAMVLCSCAAGPRPAAEIKPMDYGNPPSNHVESSIQAISRDLIDPFSAHYRLCSPSTGYVVRNWKEVHGWLVCGEVNSKNRMGGYTGWKETAVFYQGGAPVAVEFGMTAFKWCGGTPGGFVTRGNPSLCGDCPEIR